MGLAMTVKGAIAEGDKVTVEAQSRGQPLAGLQRIGIGVPRSTGTAVTAFCGEPSITRSE